MSINRDADDTSPVVKLLTSYKEHPIGRTAMRLGEDPEISPFKLCCRTPSNAGCAQKAGSILL